MRDVAWPRDTSPPLVRSEELGPQKSSGLQRRLRGPTFRRFLAHGTTMSRRTVENLSSRSHCFASKVSVVQAPAFGRSPGSRAKVRNLRRSTPSRATCTVASVDRCSPTVAGAAPEWTSRHLERRHRIPVSTARLRGRSPWATRIVTDRRHDTNRRPLLARSDCCEKSAHGRAFRCLQRLDVSHLDTRIATRRSWTIAGIQLSRWASCPGAWRTTTRRAYPRHPKAGTGPRNPHPGNAPAPAPPMARNPRRSANQGRK